MVLLRSTSPRSYHAKTTFRARPVEVALPEKVVLIGNEALAPEEQYVYSSEIPDVSRSVRSGM